MLAGSGANKSDERWATARGAQGPSTRDNSGAHCVVTDPELHPDLNQGEAVGIEASRLFTNGLLQRWRTGFESGPPRDLADGAAMHLEAGGELLDRHPRRRTQQAGRLDSRHSNGFESEPNLRAQDRADRRSESAAGCPDRAAIA